MSYYGKRLCCRCHLVPREGSNYCKPCRAKWFKRKSEDPEFRRKNNVRCRRWYRKHLKEARRDGRIYAAQWRKDHPRKAREASHRSWRKKSDANRELIRDWKLAHPCSHCGETDPVVLDAHHLNPRTKKFRIGIATYHKSLKDIRAELEKCIALCANCHRRAHNGR